MFDGDVFTDNEAVGGQFEEFGEDAGDVFGEIDEDDEDREVAAGVDEVGGVDVITSVEAGDGVESAGTGDIFAAQHLEDLVPLIGFVEVDGDLDGGVHESFGYRLRARMAPRTTAMKHITLEPRMLRAARVYWPRSKRAKVSKA